MANIANVNELDSAAVIDRIQALWKEGKFLPRTHAQQRMRERNISVDAIGQVLCSGQVVDWHHPGPMSGWRYNVQGKTNDGLRLSCIVELRRHLVLVTVMEKERWR